MQIKTTLRFHHTSIKMDQINKMIAHADKDMKKGEHYYSDDGGTTCRNQFGGFLGYWQ